MSSLFSTSGKFVGQSDDATWEVRNYVPSSTGMFYATDASVVIIPDTCTFDVVWKSFTKALFTTASFRLWSDSVHSEELKACTSVESFQRAYDQLAKPHDKYITRWQAIADKFNIPLEFQ